MKEVFYEVYGCRDDGKWHQSGYLFSKKESACKYATANRGKIAYGMPRVIEKVTQTNDDCTIAQTMFRVLKEEEIVECAEKGGALQ